MNLEAAARWYIERFCPNQTTQNFALRVNNLQEMTSDERQKMQRSRVNNARYDFHFVEAQAYIAVIPNKAEAEWSRGVIWLDSFGEFQFRTTGMLAVHIYIPPPPAIIADQYGKSPLQELLESEE
jgi:hypothetical protein